MTGSERCFLPSALVVGVTEIDAQHEALFARLVALKERCLGNCLPSDDEVAALLAALRDHYATEAQQAAAIGLDFSGHARRHESMLQLVGKALREAVDGHADVFGTLRYIEYWFERHIAEDDMVLGGQSAAPHDGLPGARGQLASRA